jgi:tRNA (adenine22-N1)-methyltransferase
MRRLSDRLQKIAGFIEPGEKIADIGTDHGKIPIYLALNRITSKAILSDINAGPLEKARLNIKAHAPDYAFDIRQGSGLDPIKAFEVDTIIIAGMGGLLIAGILGEDLVKTRSYRKFLLQPRNAEDKLRFWLRQNSFLIVDECLVQEGKHICEIICAIPSDSESVKSDSLSMKDLPFEISPLLFAKKDPLLKEFIVRKIAVEKRNLERIIHGKRQLGKRIDEDQQIDAMKNRINDLELLIKKIDESFYLS